MASLAKWYAKTKGALVTGGSADAYTITTGSSHSALGDIGLVFARVHAVNTGASTLAVDGLTAKAIVQQDASTAMSAGDLAANGLYGFLYDPNSDKFVAISIGGGAAVLDEDDFATDSATQPPSQQSTGVYVGNEIANSLPGLCQGRLTLTDSTPVTTSDVTAATTLYFEPYKGDKVALYDGSANWDVYDLGSGVSITFSGLSADTNYDVFLYDNSGLTLELVAWSNNTTRATALTTQDGVYVKSGATARLYIGTIRTTSSSPTIECEDSAENRFVWNYYNRVKRKLVREEPVNDWTSTTYGGFRQVRNNAANQVEIVVGVNEDCVSMVASLNGSHSATTAYFSTGIGLDSTGTAASGCIYVATTINTVSYTPSIAIWDGYPGIGYHYIAWLENSITPASGTYTYYGDNNTTDPDDMQTGMSGFIMG